MLQDKILLDIRDMVQEPQPLDFSFLVSFNEKGKTTELLVNGSPADFRTNSGYPIDLTEFIEISLNIPEEHLNNFPEEFDCESIRILNQLNWCKRGGKWVTCKGPCS